MYSSLKSFSHSLQALLAKSVDFYGRYKSLIALGLLYTITRLLAALFTQMTFGGYGPAFEQFMTQGQFSVNGAYPFIQYWVEYPPMFPWLALAAYRLSLVLPPWTESMLWFGTFMRWVIVPFEVGALVLVYAIGVRFNSENDTLRSTFWYVIAFTTMYVPLGWFDVLPMFWLLLAIYFILRDQPEWTGISVGLGLLAKPISALALPAAWQRLPNIRARLKLLVTTLFSFVVPMLPFLITSPQMSLAHLQNLLTRSSWETIWAFLDGYYSYGAVAPLDQRFDPSTALWQLHAGSGSYGLLVTFGFGLLGLYLWTRRIDWRDGRRTVAFVGLTWCLFSLWSKGYSPQWAINFIPFVALLMPNLRGAVYLGLISIALVGEWPVAFTLATTQNWYFVAIVIWRTLLFVLLAFEFGTIALAGPPNQRWQGISWAATVVLLGSGTLIGWHLVKGYFQSRLDTEPLRATIRVLQKETTPHTGLICREIVVCERIAPFIPGVDYYWLPTPSGWQADYLPAFARQHAVLWLVEEFHEGSGHNVTIESYLSEHYGKESQDWVEGTRLSRFVALDLPPEQTTEAIFGCCLRLTSYTLHAEDHFINVSLNWQAIAHMAVSYKIFIHVYNRAGELVAQNDQYPAGGFLPTDQWAIDETVHDLHGLILPETPEPGYYLQIGWYDPITGQRLFIAGSETDVFKIVIQ